MVGIRHEFISEKDDSEDETLIRPSDWNAAHVGVESSVDYGLSFEGTITTYTDTTHFASTALAGKGDGYFIGYYVYVVWDSGGAGAAPQGEWRLISGYTSATGTFAHTAFSTPLAEGDKVLIQHPNIDTLAIDTIYYDSVSGVAGTAWPIGTPLMPVNNYADLKTIVTARKVSKVNVTGHLTFTSNWLTDKNYIFEGQIGLNNTSYSTVNLSTYNVSCIIFKYLYITAGINLGDGTGPTLEKCIVGNLGQDCLNDSNFQIIDSLIDAGADLYLNCATFINCIFLDGITIYAQSEHVYILGGYLEGTLHIGNCEGGIVLNTHNGEIEITDEFEYYGEAYIYGDSKIIDSASGRVTIYDYFTHKAGKVATFTKNITSAANAGDVTIATVKNGTCLIKSVVLRSNGATTADLTSAAIYGGASKVITFLDDTEAAKANIDAIDEQVSWTGAVTLKADKTIVIDLEGTGDTAVDLDIDIEYEAITDAAYLT